MVLGIQEWIRSEMPRERLQSPHLCTVIGVRDHELVLGSWERIELNRASCIAKIAQCKCPFFDSVYELLWPSAAVLYGWLLPV